MDISIFFARLWGAFFITFGLLFIITRQLGKTIEMTGDKSFVISTGYITYLMGLVTVILHNVWVLDWRLVITVLGWSTLIKGITKIGFPEQIHKQAQRFKKKQWLSAFFLTLLGGWLMWVSFKSSLSLAVIVTDFESCVAAGNPVLESYPRRCNTPDGHHFVEQVANPNEPVATTNPGGVACTMEARQCPDGSYVGRVGSNCEFVPCP